MAYWHSRIASVKDYWLCILTVGWLAVTGWQMTSAAEMPGSRILGPSSGATIINPASDRAHQPARGATTPLPKLWRPWSNSNSVLLTIFSCSFVSYFYLHVPRFCHRLVLRTCLPGLCLPLQIATSHYTHPDKLQTSDVLHPSKIPKPWWVSSIRNCFSNTMSVI